MKITTSNEFDNEIKDGLTLVDFSASWCGPCKMLTPVLEGLAEEMNGKAKIVKVDIDESRDLADKFQIVSVPTMIMFKDGERVDTMIGFSPKEGIQKALEAHL